MSQFDGLVQERRNSIANTLELFLFALTHQNVYLFGVQVSLVKVNGKHLMNSNRPDEIMYSFPKLEKG